MTYLIHQMKELEDASWIKAQRYHTPCMFNSDEDDLLGDDDLLVDNYSDEYYDETNDNDKEKIESLTKELNTLKLAHETILGDHRELLRTHEKLRFEKLNLEQEHEFLKAINDDLRKKSSSYIVKRLLFYLHASSQI